MSEAAVLDRIVERIRRGESFLISSHVRLDGDAVACMLALDLLLRSEGKRSLMLTDGPVPEVFRFLPAADRIVNLEDTPDAPVPADIDTVIVVDLADAARLGAVRERLPEGAFIVCIDHHKTGDLAAGIDYSDASVSSAGELVYRLLKHARLPFTPDIATNIYAAVMTDTQRFSLPNTTPDALRIAAEMVECGADPGYIGDRLYRSYQPGQLTLWGEVAGRLCIDPDGRLAWTSLTDDMLTRHGVHAEDTQDFTDIARMLSGVEVGVLFRERADGKGVRVSFRSNRIPVLPVAERFGGGGHDLACGCELDGSLGEVEDVVLAAVREVIAKSAAAAG